ncbi:MAG: hypothetical protein BMS9Abin37_2877 [Acidobacteriota bacterium]|nr:MAG: hypothetical protein BMS9Abin37_2877 [Acidobacteriota bacterium]
MPIPTRTARERWSQFLTFIVQWVLAAVVGSASLFYLTGGSDPLPAAPETEPTQVALEDRAPEPAPAPVSEDVVEAPAPAPDIKHARENVRKEPTPLEPVPVMTDGERASKVATHIRRAATATEARDYEEATLAYQSALELEPNNFEVKILMAQVTALSELEAREAGQRFRETRTELTTDGSRSESQAAELIIEILPSAPNPGDPYILRVRAHNASDRGLALTSVELVDAHSSMKSEQGRPGTPLAQQIGPKETALLWERRSDWTVADRTGVIDVVVILADGSRLSKSLRW